MVSELAGEGAMPLQIPTLARRLLKIAELRDRLRQQIRRGSLLRRGVTKLNVFYYFNRSIRAVQSINQVLVNAVFAVFDRDYGSRSVECMSTTLVNQPSVVDSACVGRSPAIQNSAMQIEAEPVKEEPENPLASRFTCADNDVLWLQFKEMFIYTLLNQQIGGNATGVITTRISIANLDSSYEAVLFHQGVVQVDRNAVLFHSAYYFQLLAQYLKEKSLSFELVMSILEHSDEIDSSAESVTTSTYIGQFGRPLEHGDTLTMQLLTDRRICPLYEQSKESG
nr:trafficking protein particle complex subunit 11 [Ipomoea batatas]